MDRTPSDPPMPSQALPVMAGRNSRHASWRAAPPPVTSAELIADGVRAELLESLALRRALGGRVAKCGDHYYDGGRLIPSYLMQVLGELTEAGLLSLATNARGMRRLRLTNTGHARYAQFHATPGTRHAQAVSCGSVLAPIPGLRYECAQAPGHDTGPDPTPCTDAGKTIQW